MDVEIAILWSDNVYYTAENEYTLSTRLNIQHVKCLCYTHFHRSGTFAVTRKPYYFFHPFRYELHFYAIRLHSTVCVLFMYR